MTERARQETCEERVERHMASRLDDIRTMLRLNPSDVVLVDDGTLDTVLSLGDHEFRYSQENAADYRDEDTGELDLDSLVSDEWGRIEDELQEHWYEYGLSFDYVPAGTSSDQEQGWFSYQISCGGPSEEIRFYVDAGLTMYRAEFWLLDWFDGASRPLDKDDAEMIWDALTAGGDPDTTRFLIDKATD